MTAVDAQSAYFVVPLLADIHTLQSQLKHSINCKDTFKVMNSEDHNIMSPVMMLVLADTLTSLPKLTVQTYSPESDDLREVRVHDDVYSVRDFIAGLVAVVMVVPSGLVHTMLIITGTSTIGLNSTVQVRVGEDPERMGLGVSEIRLTVGWGAACREQMLYRSLSVGYRYYYIIGFALA